MMPFQLHTILNCIEIERTELKCFWWVCESYWEYITDLCTYMCVCVFIVHSQRISVSSMWTLVLPCQCPSAPSMWGAATMIHFSLSVRACATQSIRPKWSGPSSEPKCLWRAPSTNPANLTPATNGRPALVSDPKPFLHLAGCLIWFSF